MASGWAGCKWLFSLGLDFVADKTLYNTMVGGALEAFNGHDHEAREEKHVRVLTGMQDDVLSGEEQILKPLELDE